MLVTPKVVKLGDDFSDYREFTKNFREFSQHQRQKIRQCYHRLVSKWSKKMRYQ